MRFLPLIPSDKANHIIWSAFLAGSSASVFHASSGMAACESALMGGVVVFTVGLLKELWDHRSGGNPELMDMVADMVGWALVAIPCMVLS